MSEPNNGGTILAEPIAPKAPPAEAAAAPAAPSWRDSLPEELRADPSLAMFNDTGALAKSYIHSQKLIGKKAGSIMIPDEHASDEDRMNVFHQLGNPKELKDYKLDVEKDSGLDDNFVNAFKENAHKQGILPKQAQALLKWYTETSKSTIGAHSEGQKNAEIEGLKGLQKEWGDKYDNNLLAAKLVLKDFGDDETVNFLNESRLGNNPNLLKFLAKIGGVLKEEDIKGEALRRGGDEQARTPQGAQTEIDKIMGDFKHPYYNKNHPGHLGAVAEVQKLMNYAHPSKK